MVSVTQINRQIFTEFLQEFLTLDCSNLDSETPSLGILGVSSEGRAVDVCQTESFGP